MTKVKVHPEVIKFFVNNGSIIQTVDDSEMPNDALTKELQKKGELPEHPLNTYAYYPFWMKILDDQSVEILSWDYLPSNLKSAIEEAKNKIIFPPKKL